MAARDGEQVDAGEWKSVNLEGTFCFTVFDFFFTHCHHNDDCHEEPITVYPVDEYTLKTIKLWHFVFLGCIAIPITTVCLGPLTKWL